MVGEGLLHALAAGGGDLAADHLVPQPVVRGVLGGQLAGAGPLVLVAQIAEHGDDPVADPGRVGGAHRLVQRGLAVFPAGDVDQDDVVAGQVWDGRGGR